MDRTRILLNREKFAKLPNTERLEILRAVTEDIDALQTSVELMIDLNTKLVNLLERITILVEQHIDD